MRGGDHRLKIRKPRPGSPGLYDLVDAIPCPHKGTPTGEARDCKTCGGTIKVPLLTCSLHGVCSEDKAVTEANGNPVRCCLICPDRPATNHRPEPKMVPTSSGTPGRVAPLDVGWNGEGKRPWQFDVTVVLPHLNTVEQLRLAIDLWRCSLGVTPFFQVIDTGSPVAVLLELERLRSEDVELHYVRAHAYRHSSAPVTAALDLAHSLCRTEYLFHTHTDVFPLRQEFLFWMRQQCSATQPVVGWRMSPRSTSDEWRQCVSHTATMVHMPTARKAGLTWAMERYYDERPEERKPTTGWPDTESPFMLAMRAANISPVFLGEEANFRRHQLESGGIAWADHARSYPGLKSMPHDKRWVDAQKYMAEAERDARDRLSRWSGQATAR